MDRSIPYYNVIMRLDAPPPGDLPKIPGIRFRNYEPGDEKDWARLECEAGDFNDPAEAERYFLARYGRDTEKLRRRCLLAVEDSGRVAGACVAWRDERGGATVASLHWLVVEKRSRNRGIGGALCRRVLRIFEELNEFPVYLHTQPWSYAAISLYGRLGFRLQKTESFANYQNEYLPAMETLKTLLPEARWALLAAEAEN